jgi:hypothetical protein
MYGLDRERTVDGSKNTTLVIMLEHGRQLAMKYSQPFGGNRRAIVRAATRAPARDRASDQLVLRHFQVDRGRNALTLTSEPRVEASGLLDGPRIAVKHDTTHGVWLCQASEHDVRGEIIRNQLAALHQLGVSRGVSCAQEVSARHMQAAQCAAQ